jgi:hypothetical protein
MSSSADTDARVGARDFLSQELLGHGAYLCARAARGRDLRAAGVELVPALVKRLQLRNEFDPAEAAPNGTIAFARRRAATPGDIEDDDVLRAQVVIHVASRRPEVVDDFCGEMSRRLSTAGPVRVLRGSIRAKIYTGAAMNRWAYERAVVPQPGAAAPNAFLLPLSKIAEWWKKDWMERHTYFLPTYDARGGRTSEGHALAAEAGIECLLRRTYRAATEPAPNGEYDFVTYFECADRDVPVFHRVCASLRDVARNPEWRFVREGPMWHGRRVVSWDALFAAVTPEPSLTPP